MLFILRVGPGAICIIFNNIGEEEGPKRCHIIIIILIIINNTIIFNPFIHCQAISSHSFILKSILQLFILKYFPHSIILTSILHLFILKYFQHSFIFKSIFSPFILFIHSQVYSPFIVFIHSQVQSSFIRYFLHSFHLKSSNRPEK